MAKRYKIEDVVGILMMILFGAMFTIIGAGLLLQAAGYYGPTNG